MTEFHIICFSGTVALAAFLLLCVGMILNSRENAKKPRPVAVIFFILGGFFVLCSPLFFGLIYFVLMLLKETCIDPLKKEACRDSYDNGCELGRELGTAVGHKEGYISGWKKGYRSGAHDGYSAGWLDCHRKEEYNCSICDLEHNAEAGPDPLLFDE